MGGEMQRRIVVMIDSHIICTVSASQCRAFSSASEEDGREEPRQLMPEYESSHAPLPKGFANSRLPSSSSAGVSSQSAYGRKGDGERSCRPITVTRCSTRRPTSSVEA